MNSVKKLIALLVAMLREIFDENAYARFLAREARIPSASAYADFIKEKHSTPIRRCC
jgi:hypothetical protein